MKSILPAVWLFILITAFSIKGIGQGVTTPSFGPSAITESFEGIPTSSNNYSVGAANGGRTVPVTPFRFSSGITLTAPDPNKEFLVEIGDFSKGFAGLYACPSQVSAADIPDGTAFLGEWNSTSLTFTFPVPAEKVGLYVEGSSCTSSNTITLTAYNAANAVIGTFTTEATGSAANWKNHFIGFNSTTDGIAKITLTGPPIVIDKLTFEKQQECFTTPSFDPSAVTESFEGIPASPNNPLYAPQSINGNGYTKPVIPFTFSSGIKLTEPNPNTGQVLIGDWSKGNSGKYLCDQAVISATDVPDGTAFLGVMDTASILTFTLPAPSRKVGMYVEGAAGTCVSSTTITLTAYNAANAVIGSCTTAATNDGSNWKNHFLGFRSLSDSITKITVSGPYIAIDKLTFEPFPCVPKTWYLDADNDGYYTGSGVTSCTAPGSNYKSTGLIAGGDCDDTNPNVKGPITLYRDFDHDGFGDINYKITVCPANIPSDYTYVTDSSDCNDNQVLYADADGDGVAGNKRVACGGSTSAGIDCDDTNPNIQGPVLYFLDADSDGYGNSGSPEMICPNAPHANYVTNADDCNDNAAAINPATVWYLDNDNDGYYTGTGIASCTSPGTGYKYTGLLGGGDCADGNGLIHPGAVEICNNGIDDNCNGQVDEGCTVTYSLSISDVSMAEGNKGKSNMTFTVTLNKAINKKVTVQYTTRNGTATAGSDYTAKSGTLTFKPNNTKQTLSISITADKTIEPNETFTVVLSNPVNANLLKGSGTGTILNDDGTTTTATMQAVDVRRAALEVSGKLTVTVSPNPSRSYFTLHTQSNSDKPLLLRTVDALGRVIETKGNVPANGTVMLGGNYRPGTYFTEVWQGNERLTLKLVKQSN